MFYGQHKTLWYQFGNFKHFLKAENSEDSFGQFPGGGGTQFFFR